MCFSLNVSDSQLADLAIQGMHPWLREKLMGNEFANLGTLAQRIAALIEQWQYQHEDEVATIEWNWSKRQVVIPNPWGRSQEAFDFDVSKVEKIFDYLLEKG